ncbi:MAG: hypothetical protein P4M12_08915 [Gammaproteobacteria bacterium]|nr:hypothetical protein [Gammaproteobacteria bacterium]
MPQKYIIQNGRPVLNPQYQVEAGYSSIPTSSNSIASAPSSLVVVSTMADQTAMCETTNLDMPKLFVDALSAMQSDEYVAKFKAQDVDSGVLIDGLTKLFGQYEIPIGLMSKLTDFQDVRMHFKIDDSGSMTEKSNLSLCDASPYTQNLLKGQHPETKLTRWQEAEDRLHTYIDLLAYVPTGEIVLSNFDSLDRHNRLVKSPEITLDRNGKSPDQFSLAAHIAIRQFFNRKPCLNTPIFLNMTNMINMSDEIHAKSELRTSNYLLTDGIPSGGVAEITQAKNLLQTRKLTSNPFTFLGCSNNPLDYKWTHEVSEIAPFSAAIPDFKDEKKIVLDVQGKVFPYTRGLWLLCSLAAALNRDDLFAINQDLPLTKLTIENVLGRSLTDNEYKYYFECHPCGRTFSPDYMLFYSATIANDIEAVRVYKDASAKAVNQDLNDNKGGVDDDDEAIARAAVDNFYYNRQAQQQMAAQTYQAPTQVYPPQTYQAPTQVYPPQTYQAPTQTYPTQTYLDPTPVYPSQAPQSFYATAPTVPSSNANQQNEAELKPIKSCCVIL